MRLWHGSVAIWRRPKTTTWGEIATGALALTLVFWFGLGQIQALKDAEVARATRDAQATTFQSDVRAYDAAVNARDICVDSISRSDNNREQWTLLADIIAALDNGTGKATAFAEQIRSGPVLAQAPRVLSDCPTIPPIPTPPGG